MTDSPKLASNCILATNLDFEPSHANLCSITQTVALGKASVHPSHDCPDEEPASDRGQETPIILSISATLSASMIPIPRPFLSWPREIRGMIYGFLFERPRAFYKHSLRSWCSFDTNLAFRLSCKTVHTETSEWLFRSLSLAIEDCDTEPQEGQIVTRCLPLLLLNSIRHLVIVICIDRLEEPLHGYLPVTDLPLLQSLKIVRLPMGWGKNVGPHAMEFRLNRVAKRVLSLFSSSGGRQRNWLLDLIALPDRTFTIDHEAEVWLQRARIGEATIFRTFVVAYGETDLKSGRTHVSRTALDLTQFRDRSEFYCAMKNDINLEVSGRTSVVLARLALMQYQEEHDLRTQESPHA